MKKLSPAFYLQSDVVAVARQLLGKVLVTNIGGEITKGRIVETEAYNGVIDKASHAFGGRRTNRTEIMFSKGGVAYVYLCYGMHHLFNIVTNKKDIPHAVLIRALEPMSGIETMLERRSKTTLDSTLTKGPGSAAKAMGISTEHSGISLSAAAIAVYDDGFAYSASEVLATPRIGVDYAGEDAWLPYRFLVKGNVYVSGKKVTS